MPGYRQDQINDAVAGALTEILRTVKDPRVGKRFVSIAGAEVTRDLSIAKVYYSVLGPDADVQKGLEAASGYIRTALARQLNLRITPKLVFLRDRNTERAMDISKILKDIEHDGKEHHED